MSTNDAAAQGPVIDSQIAEKELERVAAIPATHEGSSKKKLLPPMTGNPFRGLSLVFIILELPWLLLNPPALWNLWKSYGLVNGKGGRVLGLGQVGGWVPTSSIFVILCGLHAWTNIPERYIASVAVIVLIWTIIITCSNMSLGVTIGVVGAFGGLLTTIIVLDYTGNTSVGKWIVSEIDAISPGFDIPTYLIIAAAVAIITVVTFVRSHAANSISQNGNNLHGHRAGGGADMPVEGYKIRVCTLGYEDRFWFASVDILVIPAVTATKVEDADDAYKAASYVMYSVPCGTVVARALSYATSTEFVDWRRRQED